MVHNSAWLVNIAALFGFTFSIAFLANATLHIGRPNTWATKE